MITVGAADEKIKLLWEQCDEGCARGRQGPDRRPKLLQLHVSWAPTDEEAIDNAMREWPNGGMAFPKQDIKNPEDFAAMAKLVRPERLQEPGPDLERPREATPRTSSTTSTWASTRSTSTTSGATRPSSSRSSGARSCRTCAWADDATGDPAVTDATRPEADALARDAADPLTAVRDRFRLPTSPARPGGPPPIYFAGQSLGLQPRSVGAAVAAELDRWAEHGVDAFFDGRPAVVHARRRAARAARPDRRRATGGGRAAQLADGQPPPAAHLVLPAGGAPPPDPRRRARSSRPTGMP